MRRCPFAQKEKAPEKSSEEIDKLVAEWQPDSLIPSTGKPSTPQTIVTTVAGARVKLKDDPTEYTNFVTYNFLGLVGNTQVRRQSTPATRLVRSLQPPPPPPPPPSSRRPFRPRRAFLHYFVLAPKR